MQVGDKVWIFDGNRRIYTDPEGNKLSSPWYRGYFVERYILGETKQSWLLSAWEYEPDKKYTPEELNRRCTKYKKKDCKGIFTSEEQITQYCWVNDNGYKIGSKVQSCRDYNILKQIEDILNQQL